MSGRGDARGLRRAVRRPARELPRRPPHQAEIQRAWRQVRNTEHMVGFMDLNDERSWLRQLDYYAYLHAELDRNLQGILDVLDELGIYDDTVIAYTSDHGDACGSHGLRAKLPCVYEEVMGVPLIMKVPGVTQAGTETDALATHVDLATTLCALGGVDIDDAPTLSGSTSPPPSPIRRRRRGTMSSSQDAAQSDLIANTRYAVRGFFDGETKYARYYGIGGGVDRAGNVDERPKLFGEDAAFEDHDHEWYEPANDPHELINLANDVGRKGELREHFNRLLEIELAELGDKAGHQGRREPLVRRSASSGRIPARLRHVDADDVGRAGVVRSREGGRTSPARL